MSAIYWFKTFTMIYIILKLKPVSTINQAPAVVDASIAFGFLEKAI